MSFSFVVRCHVDPPCCHMLRWRENVQRPNRVVQIADQTQLYPYLYRSTTRPAFLRLWVRVLLNHIVKNVPDLHPNSFLVL
jgi:hypothetical protein